MEIMIEHIHGFDPRYTAETGFAFHNLYEAMNMFYFCWNSYINLLLFSDDPDIHPGEIFIFKGSGEKLKQEIEAFTQKIKLSKLKNISFIRIVEKESLPLLDKIDMAMGAEQELHVKAEQSVYGTPARHFFTLVKINSNWRIISIFP
jgi:hypothetical protein